MKYHYTQEVVNKGLTRGNSIVKYTSDAAKFANNASWYFNNMYGVGGYFTSSGKIITFWF